MADENIQNDDSSLGVFESKSPEVAETQENPDFMARAKEIEEELEKLKQIQKAVMTIPAIPKYASSSSSEEQKEEIDTRSIYVGNVDYGARTEELKKHFIEYGTIYRVNIMCNKIDGHPKGFAYIEFGSKEFAEAALALNGSLFRGRQIKVGLKRTNRPGMCTTNRFPRGSRGRRPSGISRGACCHAARLGPTRGLSRRGYRGRTMSFAPY